MALTPAFTIAQSATSPNLVVATDTSSGADAAVSQRRIFFQTASGTYLVTDGVLTDYIPWALADVSESFAILATDQALAITVQWLNVSDVVLYTLTQLYCLDEYNKQFFYTLIQQQGLTPTIIQDANYFANMSTYWMNIIGAEQAVEIGADIAASQNCLDRATYMKNNTSLYF